ncbi:MAG: cytidylate kinase-like family protein [Clostridia bacterium]|nr:cytidylate kinase-like family protein [Clostridia bacterium]MBQ8926495.1 cytidylate kinase-like family protein [Clostridia bacterium]
MKEKVIIHISREHGSLGHVVGEQLAERLDCKLYDKKLIEEIAEEHGLDKEFLKEYEEKPKRSLLYRLAQGVSADLEEELTKQVFEKIRGVAETEDRAVIVGRCAGTVLKEYPNVVNVFLTARMSNRIRNIMEYYGIDYETAQKRILDVDKDRQRFHDTYSDTKWKNVDNYDLVISTTDLGVDGAVDLILNYIAHLD